MGCESEGKRGLGESCRAVPLIMETLTGIFEPLKVAKSVLPDVEMCRLGEGFARDGECLALRFLKWKVRHSGEVFDDEDLDLIRILTEEVGVKEFA